MIPLNVALDSRLLSSNARISSKSAKPSAQTGRRIRGPSKPAKSIATVFRNLTEKDMNFKSTKSTENNIGPNPGFLPGIFFGGGESIIMQISFVMLLFSDQISGKGKVSKGGTASGGGRPRAPPCPLWKKARINYTLKT